MKIKKKAIIISFSFFLLCLLIIGSFLGYRTIKNTWEDSSTWTIENTVSLPENLQDFKIRTETEGDSVKITVDYCVLYEINAMEGEKEYNCSLQPLYNWSLMMYDPNETSSENQISFTIKDGTQPNSFLSRGNLSEESVGSFGSTPVPVSIYLEYRASSVKGSIGDYVNHYKEVQENGTESISAEIYNWEVNDIPSFTSISNIEEEEFKRNFLESALSDVNKVIEKNEWDDFSNDDLMRYISNYMTESKYTCHVVENELSCYRSNTVNFAASLFYYYYSDKTESGGQLLGTMFSHMYPFVSREKSDELDKTLCEGIENDNCAGLTQLIVYTHPVCPILKRENVLKENKQLFVNYFKALGGDYESVTKALERLNNFGIAPNSSINYSRSKFDDNLGKTMEFYLDLDATCYSMLSSGYTEEQYNSFIEIVDPWLFYNYDYVDQAGNVKDIKTDNLWEFVYYNTKLQPYDYSLISSSGVVNYMISSGVSAYDYESNLYVSFDIENTLFIISLLNE